jgi:hypothetical protein
MNAIMLVSDCESDSYPAKLPLASPVSGSASQSLVGTGAAAAADVPALAFELSGLLLWLLAAELLLLLVDVPCVHCEEGCAELLHLEQTWGYLHGLSLHGAPLFQFLQLRDLLLSPL